MRRARIRWLTGTDGQSTPGPGRYTVLARFEALGDEAPDPGWQVLLSIGDPADASGETLAIIALLVPETAPLEVLFAGRRFDLFEGPRHVAHGEVL